MKSSIRALARNHPALLNAILGILTEVLFVLSLVACGLLVSYLLFGR